ncbi:hypothetical protein LCGC14_1605670 [marine sediment metagenome]|uniref:Uncharacterized protein n=1 Tax=marine sediment metagenome TaxID=412755 RepID=A0A0F9IA61_9ZZZZ
MINSYFGKADRARYDGHGKILNPVPLWMNDKYKQDLKKDIRQIEQQEREGFISPKERATKMARKQKKVDILRFIKESDPRNNSGFNKDCAKKAKDSVLEKIRYISPCLSANPKVPSEFDGAETNPQEEGNKSKNPCISLDTTEEVEEAKRANLRIAEIEGKPMVSRDDATRMVRLLAVALGVRVGYQAFRKRPILGRKGSQVGWSEEYSGNYEGVFDPNKVTIDRDEYERLKAAGEALAVKHTKKKPGKPWSCSEPGCGFEGTTKQKGMHIARHRKEAKRKKKELVTT